MSTLKDKMRECATFLTAIWGLEDKGLYAIVVIQERPEEAAAGTDKWHDYGFRWPKGLPAALKRIAAGEEAGANTYICPALYNEPTRAKGNVAGSNAFWMDSDGNAPTVFDGAVPAPSIRIRTSYEGNIHDYWMLDEFLDDVEALETGNRSITSYFEADASGWDATQLLRPPGTTNRKNGLPVYALAGLG
jgi:hypothetical protein